MMRQSFLDSELVVALVLLVPRGVLGVSDASCVVSVGLVSGEHLSSVGVGLDDSRFAIEEIDLLESETLGLGNAEAVGD